MPEATRAPARLAMTVALALRTPRLLAGVVGGLGRRGIGGGHHEGMVLHHRERAAGDALDIAQIAALIGGAEGEGRAARPRPGSPPDAVDIALGHVRDLVVDHM